MQFDESDAYEFTEQGFGGTVQRFLIRVDGVIWTKSIHANEECDIPVVTLDWLEVFPTLDPYGWNLMVDEYFQKHPAPEHILEDNPDYLDYAAILDRVEIESEFTLQGNPQSLSDGAL